MHVRVSQQLFLISDFSPRKKKMHRGHCHIPISPADVTHLASLNPARAEQILSSGDVAKTQVCQGYEL